MRPELQITPNDEPGELLGMEDRAMNKTAQACWARAATRRWVLARIGTDEQLDEADLIEAFGALYDREPDACDRAQGLWKMCVEAALTE